MGMNDLLLWLKPATMPVEFGVVSFPINQEQQTWIS